MIHKQNFERIKRMKESPRLFIMDSNGNIVQTATEIKKAIMEVEDAEKNRSC